MSSRSKAIPSYRIVEASWHSAAPELCQIRTQVFIIEQGVAPALEWDDQDEQAIHLLAFDQHENPVGCTRILNDGVIGRMAVLQANRGLGIGSALLEQAIACCHARGWMDIRLSAQTHAIAFYQRAEFRICSEEYAEAGILHCDMQYP